ncbi:RNA-directed DNA polymerase, eukaryota, reverse transcriptase zinc-binding domain protein [Tanacetum coccineum]
MENYEPSGVYQGLVREIITFDLLISVSVGIRRGILCIWDTNSFKKWDGEVLIMGDFNEVRRKTERFGSVFNVQGVDMFNTFIANADLKEIPLGSSSFTWCHKSATKMSKLDRFLISEIYYNSYPDICAYFLGSILIDHRLDSSSLNPIMTTGRSRLVPLTVLRSLESIRCQFFNGHELKSNKSSWVKWNSVLAAKEKGGLGVSSLFALNRALLMKWFWRFYSHNDSLWVRVIRLFTEFDEAFDEEAILEEQILTLMYHFADRFTDRRVEINNLMVLHDHPLIDYGLKINVHKSHLLGVGVPNVIVDAAASSLGSSIMKTPFMYLGVPVGGNMSNIKAWDDIIRKIKSRLSKWKVKTLSIGGRLTLLKSVLGSTPIYWMSLYKVPKAVLASMEAIKHGGLGVSSFYALNRALLFKWGWRYISQDNSLWARVISSNKFQDLVLSPSSLWISIVREVRVLKSCGVDLVSYCKKRVGNGSRTSFWEEVWIGDNSLSSVFPRIFALENNKSCSVADKLHDGLVRSLRRQNLNRSGLFRVSDIRNLVDETFLPKDEVATRWIKYIPIKINIFAWKVHLDRLPTRLNLVHRGVQLISLVDGGIWVGPRLALMLNGCLGSKISEWVPSSNLC